MPDDRAPNSPRSGEIAGGARPDRYKWVALSNTTLGMFMAMVDGSIVIISLPAIFRGIRLNPFAAGNISYLLWIIMGYLLVTAVLVVTLGRLGDIVGRVRIYNLGFVVFTLASVALSLDPAHGGAGALWLILWRLVQAVGGAMLMANSAAIITDAFPAEQRGMALGINQISALAGQFIGLVLGGVLSVWDWRSVFWINVPFGIFGTIWAYRSLHELSERRPARIDWWGNLSFAGGCAMLLAAITYGIQPYHGSSMGWTNPYVLGGLIGGVVLLVVFVFVEHYVPQPRPPPANVAPHPTPPLLPLRGPPPAAAAVPLTSVRRMPRAWPTAWMPLHLLLLPPIPLLHLARIRLPPPPLLPLPLPLPLLLLLSRGRGAIRSPRSRFPTPGFTSPGRASRLSGPGCR